MTTPQRIGRYEVLDEVASGGQATVYRARDPSLNRTVALKVLHAHLSRNPEFVERFLREARAAANISHPNVVTIHEVGEESGAHFIAMEYVPRSLMDLLHEENRLPVDRTVAILREVASGLKPQNILLTADGRPKVSDFGIARATEFSGLTASGIVMGTPHYMSPEQARGDDVDHKSDLYSLGVVFYQCLTGSIPFGGQTPQQILNHHLRRQRARRP